MRNINEWCSRRNDEFNKCKEVEINRGCNYFEATFLKIAKRYGEIIKAT